jgi:DNA-binding MarR family transcriptional regulator
MKHAIERRSETFKRTSSTQMKVRLSENSKKMLDLIYYNPGLNTNTIQKKLRFESRHTLLKYMNELLANNLVDFQKKTEDRRQKQFRLTDEGHNILRLILKERMSDCLKYYFDSYSKLFLILNPEYKHSKEWIEFKEFGYSAKFVENIEHFVFSYILRELDTT